MDKRSQDLLKVAEAYAQATGLDGPTPIEPDMPLGTLSLRFAASTRFFRKLIDGELSDERLKEAEGWFSAYWPDDLEWPPDVPRRVPSMLDAHEAEMERQVMAERKARANSPP